MKILFLWIILGISLDVLLAEILAPVNASSSVEVHFLTTAIFFSLAHCVYLNIKNKHISFSLILPSLLVSSLTVYIYISDYIAESNCVIDSGKSLVLAKDYVKGLGWNERILTKDPMKLRNCELGFEYNSLEQFRLVIVSRNGNVRLNN
jgi:hypothetical protein